MSSTAKLNAIVVKAEALRDANWEVMTVYEICSRTEWEAVRNAATRLSTKH